MDIQTYMGFVHKHFSWKSLSKSRMVEHVDYRCPFFIYFSEPLFSLGENKLCGNLGMGNRHYCIFYSPRQKEDGVIGREKATVVLAGIFRRKKGILQSNMA